MKKICVLMVFIGILIFTISCSDKNAISNNLTPTVEDNKNKEEFNDDKTEKNDADTQDDIKLKTDKLRNYSSLEVPAYEKIEYKTNITANMANRGQVAEDDKFYYFINSKDLHLYKVDKLSFNNELIVSDGYVRALYEYNNLIYLLKEPKDNDEDKSFIYIISSDGSNNQLILEEERISKFVIYENYIFYTRYTMDMTIDDLSSHTLFRYDLNTKENIEIENNLPHDGIAPTNSVLYIKNDNLYYDSRRGFIEYNIKSETEKIFEKNNVGGSFKQFYDNNIYSIGDASILKYELNKGDKYQNLTLKFSDIYFIRDLNVTDKYVFFTCEFSDEAAAEENILHVFRMKHDGSELVEIYSSKCEFIGVHRFGSIYNLDNILLLMYRFEDGKSVHIIDFDGNELNWGVGAEVKKTVYLAITDTPSIDIVDKEFDKAMNEWHNVFMWGLTNQNYYVEQNDKYTNVNGIIYDKCRYLEFSNNGGKSKEDYTAYLKTIFSDEIVEAMINQKFYGEPQIIDIEDEMYAVPIIASMDIPEIIKKDYEKYYKINEAWRWIYINKMPPISNRKEDDTYKDIDGVKYYKVNHDIIKNVSNLENYLLTLFDKEYVKNMMSQRRYGKAKFIDINNELYCIDENNIEMQDIQDVKINSNLWKVSENKYKYIAIIATYNFDTGEYLDFNAKEYPYEFINGRWVFTDFFTY